MADGVYGLLGTESCGNISLICSTPENPDAFLPGLEPLPCRRCDIARARRVWWRRWWGRIHAPGPTAGNPARVADRRPGLRLRARVRDRRSRARQPVGKCSESSSGCHEIVLSPPRKVDLLTLQNGVLDG